VEVLWPAAFTIVAGLTGRFTIDTVIAVKAAIVATAIARFRNFRKIEIVIVIRYGIFFRIRFYNRIGFKFGVNYYTGLCELDITTSAAS